MRKKIRRTGKRKAATAIGLAMLLGMTGCAGKAAEPETTQENVSAEKEESNGGAKDEQEGGYAADEPSIQESKWEEPLPIQDADNADSGAAESKEPEEGSETDELMMQEEVDSPDSSKEDSKEPEDERQTVSLSQGTEHLGGKVQNPQADGMTFAQTTLVDEDGMVTLLDVKDAKQIPVKFTEETKVEHWTIQGGGAGIDMQNAAVSDLKEGMGVELEGYFDGETFMATKVIIEDYI